MQKYFIVSFFILLFLISSDMILAFECKISDIEGKSDEELKAISDQCEIEAQEQKILLDLKQRESVTIERDISILDSKITKTDLGIKATKVKIYQIGQEIEEKEGNIIMLSEQAEETTDNLSVLVKRANELDSYSYLEAMLSEDSISRFFIDTNNFDVIKNDLYNKLSELKNIKKETQDTKTLLEETEKNERGLKFTQEKEKRQVVSYKDEKEDLLDLNRDQELEYKLKIAEKERVKKAISNRLFRTVGGVELTFGEALSLIQPYEERIGIEAALTLSILSQESGIDGMIGKNQGRCTYNQEATNKSGTVMSNSQKSSFLKILEELNMDSNTTPVSCPIYSDGAYGGAMGPSQFMPNTWWDFENETGYKNRVAKVLDKFVPSPFDNLDAFTGTALYLSDAMDRCETAFTSRFDLWSCSAAKYYSGLYNTTSNTLTRHMRPTYSYGYKVAKRAEQFQKDIDLLNN
ncbi:MAG: hypothetical protein KAR54_00970 [Candidatus Pacebacteria bacterium]|nr:hypothetical protein [Candidatus Paceibacterota bacterium]